MNLLDEERFHAVELPAFTCVCLDTGGAGTGGHNESRPSEGVDEFRTIFLLISEIAVQRSVVYES